MEEEIAKESTIRKLSPDDFIIGLTFEQATVRLAAKGLSLRMSYRDGQECICSQDFHEDRVNVAVIDNIVSEVTGRG